jgi:hypothetical protein
VCGTSFAISLQALIVLAFLLMAPAPPANAQTFSLSSALGGITFTVGGGGRTHYSGQFGTMNALGIGAPSAGVQVIPLNNGALYYSPYRLTVTGLPGTHKAGVTGFVSINFGNPAALIMQSCPSTSSCNSSAQFSAMSTSAGGTTIVPSPGIGNSTVTAGLAIFLPDNNGVTAFAGLDTVRLSLTMTDLTNNQVIGTVQIRLNLPQGETVQTAVRLTLATAAGGLTVTPAADYSMNFGNVNGLGFGPGPGLTIVAAAGGVVYSTPYVLQPAFTDFTSTTATIKTFASTTFAHPTILVLRDAASSLGPYTNIGTTVGTATQITSTAANRSSITRFLGLFVSNINGATSFRGNDSATLTFTLTVP